MLANVRFEEQLHMNFEKYLHMNFGVPGSLQTPFELKLDLPASKNEPDAATLTLHALKLSKKTKTSNYVIDILFHFYFIFFFKI